MHEIDGSLHCRVLVHALWFELYHVMREHLFVPVEHNTNTNGYQEAQINERYANPIQ
jgi:hypothetical protein